MSLTKLFITLSLIAFAAIGLAQAQSTVRAGTADGTRSDGR
jgi:hypothetical protein